MTENMDADNCDSGQPIRAVEFFSGIGGLHYGFIYSGAAGSVVAAFDVNEVANQVYALNHPATKLLPTSIDHLSHETLARFNANAWFLSPPCQPFTRGGKALDDKDDRSRGLLHLTEMLRTMPSPPTFILLENVKNFEQSTCRAKLVDVLDGRGYEMIECLVEPIMVGVPNKRLRYFLLARRVHANKDGADEEQEGPYSERGLVQTEWPLRWPSEQDCASLEPISVDPISTFLDSETDPTTAVPEKWIRKTFKFNFDVVRPRSTRSATFTKAYGSHHIYGSGSLFVPNDIPNAPATEPHYVNDADELLSLLPRFFSPTEVARLHSFPESLQFPDQISKVQRYRLLGNSLNCKLVGQLMKKLLCSPSHIFVS